VQVGLFNILEERDVQIRGYPIRFDIDVLILFSANPTTYNRSGKVIPQLKDRIGSTIQTHYPRAREIGIEITRQEAAVSLDGDYPVVVPPFMEEIVEQMSICARASNYVDHQSCVSARISIANYRTMIAGPPPPPHRVHTATFSLTFLRRNRFFRAMPIFRRTSTR